MTASARELTAETRPLNGDDEGVGASRAPGPADPPSTLARLTRSTFLVPLLVLAAVIVPLNVLHVTRVAAISPIDELMHIDYLVRAAEPGFQRMSDQFSQEAMHEIACRRHPTDPLPRCGDRPYVPEEFYWRGRNVASSHSPWYYQITGIPARVLRAVLPGDSTVTWARFLGSAWLMAGFGLALAATRRLALHPWSVVPGMALLGLSPSVQHAATTVNPDATAVLAGGLVALATVRTLDRSLPVWTLAVASFAAYSLDSGNILAIIAATFFTIAVVGRRAPARAAGSVALLGLGVAAAWAAQGVLLNLLGIVDFEGSPQEQMFAIDALTGPMVWGENTVFALIPPTKGYVYPAVDTPAHRAVAALAMAMTVAAIIVAPFLHGRHRLMRAASSAGLATLLVAGPLLVVLNFVQIGWFFPIPARYGLSALPFVAAAMAETVGATRGGRVALWTVAGLLASTTVLAIG